VANVNKAKGTSWETTVKEYLQSVGLMPKRTGSAEADQGDIHAGSWTFECKAEARIDLPGYLSQLAAAVGRRQTPPYHSAVWVKNRRHSVKDAYVVMSGENYRSLMVYVESQQTMLREMTAAFLKYETAGQDA
jgi:hypothetical protein